MTGVQTCALPICFPVTIPSTLTKQGSLTSCRGRTSAIHTTKLSILTTIHTHEHHNPQLPPNRAHLHPVEVKHPPSKQQNSASSQPSKPMSTITLNSHQTGLTYTLPRSHIRHPNNNFSILTTIHSHGHHNPQLPPMT